MQLRPLLLLAATHLTPTVLGTPATGVPNGCENNSLVAFAQCVFFDNDDDYRGTYDADVTKQACKAYGLQNPPVYHFDSKIGACFDKVGVGHSYYRRLCNADFAKTCFGVGGGRGQGGYGPNGGDTVKKMFGYADGEPCIVGKTCPQVVSSPKDASPP